MHFRSSVTEFINNSKSPVFKKCILKTIESGWFNHGKQSLDLKRFHLSSIVDHLSWRRGGCVWINIFNYEMNWVFISWRHHSDNPCAVRTVLRRNIRKTNNQRRNRISIWWTRLYHLFFLGKLFCEMLPSWLASQSLLFFHFNSKKLFTFRGTGRRFLHGLLIAKVLLKNAPIKKNSESVNSMG